MTTYSIRCRVHACRHRRVTKTHPDDYKIVPKCPVCGSKNGWRIENRDYNKRNLCNCNGPESSQEHGKHFPHRTTHPLCENNPNGLRNQAKRQGIADEDLPLELMGKQMKEDEPCPF